MGLGLRGPDLGLGLDKYMYASLKLVPDTQISHLGTTEVLNKLIVQVFLLDKFLLEIKSKGMGGRKPFGHNCPLSAEMGGISNKQTEELTGGPTDINNNLTNAILVVIWNSSF